ncbi:hypothetical protein PtrM4_054220 [Pyrenophora tritici-repentis]|uniref:Uncharacterized protein n=1 Tax=Pyrenophora tritici-repentis TaxID=45151 RepID=A0A834VK81_9PLEO|nr:hypothetical protein PtrM4_054220 [Pyrenophora tritici-repentis]
MVSSSRSRLVAVWVAGCFYHRHPCGSMNVFANGATCKSFPQCSDTVDGPKPCYSRWAAGVGKKVSWCGS